MRRLGQLLGTGALVLACAACGQQDEVGFGGAPSATGAPASTSISPPAQVPPVDGSVGNFVPPAGAKAVDATKVDASALPAGYPAIAWTEGDGSAVGVYGQAGGCIEASAATTDQSDQKVVVLITETSTSGGMCTMELRFPPLAVKLDKPLGDRTVVLRRTQVGPR